MRPVNSSEEWTEIENVTSTIMMNHYNLGWDSYQNGYFNDKLFYADAGDYRYDIRYFTIKK